MSPESKDMLRKLALRKYNDPTASIETRQLARGILMLLDGKLPAAQQRRRA